MWNFFNCYLSGRHDYGMWCGSGQIFLRCVHCGKRSPGWAVEAKTVPATAPRGSVTATAVKPGGRVVPFTRAAAS
jgi:hypothetical protein